MFINLKEVYKIYKGEGTQVKALRGVDLNIEKSEFLIIKGPSGSGKSTLMHILGMLDTPSSGRYFFENEDVSKLGSKKLSEIRNKEIGFVFQSFNLLPRTRVLDNVMLPLLYGKKDKNWNIKKRATEVLKGVGLEHRIKHLSNQLSGGETQRVAIARSLVNEPSLILADEPTGNLDSKSANSIMGLIRGLNEEKRVTVVVVTHEEKVASYGDRVIEIMDGRIIKK